MELTDLSDVALLESLAAVCGGGHRVTARVVAHLVEVEERRLHLNAACTSLFDFCVRKLGMSEGAAFRRINAARLVRRFPRLISSIESGAVSLCTLVLVRDLLTEETLDGVLLEVEGKTQRDVAAIVARLAPKPDVEERVTRLPDEHAQVTFIDPSFPPPGPEAATSTPRNVIAPLSEERYRVQLTASAALRDKLERARDLMRHEHPNGDLAVVIEEALDALIDRLEKQKLGKAQRPQRESRPSKPGRIRTSARREVFARDGERCTFVSESGERCPARSPLELDHVVPRACGGSSDASNLRVRCRAHNRLYAEEVFGRGHVSRAIDLRQRKRRPDPAAKERRDEARQAGDVAVRGLAAMGFSRTDSERAVNIVLAKEGTNGAPSVEQVVRGALRVLT